MIKLEKFDKPDFLRLINWIDTEKALVQFSGAVFNFPLTVDQLEKYIKTDNRLAFKVLDAETCDTIGHAELNNIDCKNNHASICRVIIGDKHNRNKGYGKLIIKELVRYGFDELKLHRIDLRVFDFNHQAIKCYLDCGFEIEGLLKDTLKIEDEYWSTFNMSIINNN
jgi:RimJ/RimL family protein N-acetyltransferase